MVVSVLPYSIYTTCKCRHSTYQHRLVVGFVSDELLSNLVFEGCWSCGNLVLVYGFNSVFECDAVDDFGEVVKAA